MSNAMYKIFYWMKERVKQKDLFLYWKQVSQNLGYYLTKNHPPHHHKEIRLTYLYMTNAIFKLNHAVVQEWANDVLKISPTVE